MKPLFFLFVFTSYVGLAAPESPILYQAHFYSAQGLVFNRGTTSHSFVRFSKVQDGKVLEVIDISWLPSLGYFRPRGRMPVRFVVPGKNYSLEDTFDLLRTRKIVFQGSYSLSETLFERARKRRAELSSGKVLYKMLDRNSIPGATNCIHAISYIVGYLPTGFHRGVSATSSLIGYFLRTRQMRPGVYLFPRLQAFQR